MIHPIVRRFRSPWFAAFLLLGLAACNEQAPVAPTDSNTVSAPSVTPAVLPSDVVPCGDVTEVTLWAGQSIEAGTVTVANDEDNIYVTYAVTGGWTLQNTYLEVATSLDGVPTHAAGNPIPGQFTYQDTHSGATEFTYTIALSDLGVEPGDDLVVAAHADVHDSSVNRSEGAWGAGDRFVESGNWATYSAYTIQECVVLVESTITAGNNHSCALSSTGAAYCWGGNESGQIGDGTTDTRRVPTAVNMPPGVESFTDISAGNFYTLALTEAGSAYAWGWSGHGQLGNGSSFTSFKSPVPVTMPAGVEFVEVSAGATAPAFNPRFTFSLALSSDGQAYAWGSNNFGALGDGTTTTNSSSTVPQPVSMPDGVTFTDVDAGGQHALAISSDGDIYAWGLDNVDQLGLATDPGFFSTEILAVNTPSGVEFTAISADAGTSLALSVDGVGYGWGTNGAGQLGLGFSTTRIDPHVETPTIMDMPTGVTFITLSAGNGHGLGLTSAGVAYAWGVNSGGQLGNGTTTGSDSPVAVDMPAETSFSAIAAGRSWSLAVAASGDGYGWGGNFLGFLGTGTTSLSELSPVKMSMPTGVRF